MTNKDKDMINIDSMDFELDVFFEKLEKLNGIFKTMKQEQEQETEIITGCTWIVSNRKTRPCSKKVGTETGQSLCLTEMEKRIREAKEFLAEWCAENQVEAFISEEIDEKDKDWAREDEKLLYVTITSSKELITEFDYLSFADVEEYPNEDERLTDEGRYLVDRIVVNLVSFCSSSTNNGKRICFFPFVGQKDAPYQAEIDKKDITLQEVLSLKMDPIKTLKRNSNLSDQNKNAMERYKKLKTMFKS